MAIVSDNIVQVALFSGAAIFGVIAYLLWQRERVRTEKLRKFATSRGFRFQEKGEPIEIHNSRLPVIRRWNLFETTNILTIGLSPGVMTIFDLNQLTGKGLERNRRHVLQTVIHIRNRALPLPEASFVPKRSHMGWIDAMKFSEFWPNLPPSRRETHRLRPSVGPGIQKIHLSFPKELFGELSQLSDTVLEMAKQEFCFYHYERRLKLQELTRAIENATRVHEILKKVESQ